DFIGPGSFYAETDSTAGRKAVSAFTVADSTAHPEPRLCRDAKRLRVPHGPRRRKRPSEDRERHSPARGREARRSKSGKVRPYDADQIRSTGDGREDPGRPISTPLLARQRLERRATAVL